jgi:hypothetical protein
MTQIRSASSIVLHSPLACLPVLAAADAGTYSGTEADSSGPVPPGAAANFFCVRTAGPRAVQPGTRAVSIELKC